MIIYILTFIIMFVLLIIPIKNEKVKKICILIGLLLPCIIAGLRAESIGTDVRVYTKPLYNLANNFNSNNLFQAGTFFNDFNGAKTRVSLYEIGFTFFIYIVAKTINNFQFLLFLIECIIIFPIYFGVNKVLKDD